MQLYAASSIIVSALCVASLFCGPRARAQAGEPEKPQSQLSLEAHAEHERGIKAFSNGRYEEAIQAFIHADQLWPNPALSYNVARAYEQLRDETRAVAYYREYLRRSPRAPDRDAVTAQIERLSQHLGEADLQSVRLTAQPAGTIVWLDEEPVGRAPATVRLLTGKHRASFRLAGYRTQDVEFEVLRGKSTPQVEAALEPEPRAEDVAARSPQDNLGPLSSEDTQNRDTGLSGKPLMRDLGVTAMIAGVGALGGAMVFELMRADAERNAKRQTEQVRYAEALDKVESRQTLARVFAGTGGGLALIGITMMILSRTQGSDAPGKTKVALYCAPAKCRATLIGTF